MVSVREIVKNYGKGKQAITALKGISFDVAKGELFGLIGPDGSGKTSLFRILTTLLLPDGGSAAVDGFDAVKDFRQIRHHIGYMPGRFSLYQDLTVEENLNFFATIFNTRVKDNYELIKDIYEQIAPFKDRKAGKLSGGMKQKLALSCALIHRPTVLFLDEPTTGVDAVSRKEFWEMLKHLKKQGITILASTPYMDEAEMCDRVALIQDGALLSVDSPAGVINAFGKPLYAAKGSNMLGLLKELERAPMVREAYAFGEYHHIVLKKAEEETGLRNYLHTAGHVVEMFPVQPNIEDCFMALMRS